MVIFYIINGLGQKIYLFDIIYIYIFFTFRYCKNKSLRLSDTVSLKYKNAKYITDQQQQKASKKCVLQKNQ